MVDHQIKTTAVGRPIDTRWRAGKLGESSDRPGQLDPTAFVSGTHYNLNGRTDNVVPSGVVLAKLASGLYGPYDPTAGTTGDARRKIAGLIGDVEGVELGDVPANSKPTFHLAVIAIVDPTKLPVVAQRTNLGSAEGNTATLTLV